MAWASRGGWLGQHGGAGAVRLWQRGGALWCAAALMVGCGGGDEAPASGDEPLPADSAPDAAGSGGHSPADASAPPPIDVAGGADAVSTPGVPVEAQAADGAPLKGVAFTTEQGRKVTLLATAEQEGELDGVTLRELPSVQLPEVEGLTLGEATDSAAVATVELGPPGRTFSEPLVVVVELGASEPALTPGSLMDVWYRASPDSDDGWSVASLSDGARVVAIAGADGRTLAFAVDHFSAYSVSLGLRIFDSVTISGGIPVLLPTFMFNSSVFSGPGTDLVFRVASSRRSAYRSALLAVMLRTELPRRPAEFSFIDRLSKASSAAMDQYGDTAQGVLAGFEWIALLADQALAHGGAHVASMADRLAAVRDASSFVAQTSGWVSTTGKVLECVSVGLSKASMYHAADYARARERFAAVRVRLEQSELYALDPAYAQALADVDSELKALQASVGAQTRTALWSLASSGCGLSALSEVIKYGSAAVLTAIAGGGASLGLLGAVVFDLAVVDVVLSEMVASTQQGVGLAALGTLCAHGALCTKTSAAPLLESSSALQQAWLDSESRQALLVEQATLHAMSSIGRVGAQILRREEAGKLSKALNWAVQGGAGLLGFTKLSDLAVGLDEFAAHFETYEYRVADAEPNACDGPPGAALLACRLDQPCSGSWEGQCGGSLLASCAGGKVHVQGCDEASGGCVFDEAQGRHVCAGGPASECAGHCGGQAPSGCWCDGACVGNDDCCWDYDAQCAGPCEADCAGKACGDDGCGGSCGTCSGGEVCGAGGQCQPTSAGCWPDCPEMVPVPAGTFWMGCNEAVDTACLAREKPYHEVYLDGYEIDVVQVTASAYQACVVAGACGEPSASGSCSTTSLGTYGAPGKESHPVNCVNWSSAKSYCEWAGKRLCTEAEWEKAARGTDGRKYPWGNAAPTCELAVYSSGGWSSGGWGCGAGSTWPVGSKPLGASPYGALDMAGNVWDWVADWYSAGYYSVSPSSNPIGPTSGSRRVIRGGSFYNSASSLRASFRGHYPPSYTYEYVGFRCCRSFP